MAAVGRLTARRVVQLAVPHRLTWSVSPPPSPQCPGTAARLSSSGLRRTLGVRNTLPAFPGPPHTTAQSPQWICALLRPLVHT